MAVSVPSQYSQYINAAAAGTGLPATVVAAQVNQESGFNPSAVSSAGALGMYQFEPSTYNSVAQQANVPINSETNVADETQAYIVYMNQLLQQEGGNVFQALEAYNAGPGNLSAGSQYATAIMQSAGVSPTLNVTNAQTTSLWSSILGAINPVSGIESDLSGAFGSGISAAVGDLGSKFLGYLGIPDFKDLLQRLGLILLGAILLFIGIGMLAKGPIVSVAQTAENVAPEAAEAAA